MSIRITCINKDNGDHYDSHEAIESLGWVNEQTNASGKWTRLQMVSFIEEGNNAYVKNTLGKTAYLAVRVSRVGNKFVQTHADGVWNNNLLALPECK